MDFHDPIKTVVDLERIGEALVEQNAHYDLHLILDSEVYRQMFRQIEIHRLPGREVDAPLPPCFFYEGPCGHFWLYPAPEKQP